MLGFRIALLLGWATLKDKPHAWLLMDEKRYRLLAAHYEECLRKHGDSHRGVDWPNKEDADTRYRMMLEVFRPGDPVPIELFDLGCGASHLYEYIVRNETPGISYSGLDISETFIELSKRKFPQNTYYRMDILDPSGQLPRFDYVVMNGVLTEKRELSYAEMLEFTENMLTKAFSLARRGIAFNVMSAHVDWEREDLFHLPLDVLAGFVVRKLSRNFVIRNDYGLYEYTTYVYR